MTPLLFLLLLASAETPAIPSMPWTELAALFAVAGAVGAGITWSLSIWLRQKYMTRGECEIRKQSTDLSKATALQRLNKVETDVKEHDGHFQRIEEHLRAVDNLALRQVALEKAAALSEQPIKEFSSLVTELKEMLKDYVRASEAVKIDHEKRLTAVETLLQVAERKRQRRQVEKDSNQL